MQTIDDVKIKFYYAGKILSGNIIALSINILTTTAAICAFIHNLTNNIACLALCNWISIQCGKSRTVWYCF